MKSFCEQRIPLLPEISSRIAEFCSKNRITLDHGEELHWELTIWGVHRIGIFISTSNAYNLHFVFYGERDYKRDCPAGLPPIYHVDQPDRRYILGNLDKRLVQVEKKLGLT